jgi:hypothetical protein
MSKVFVSHAAADSPLVDEFVSRILDNGCGLDVTQIFYSSDRDTGVPSGYNLLSYVQHEVGSADLVIAIVSPMFQTRPVCVAELGAAWSRTGNLFPLAVPGMARPDMEGVLEGMTVFRVDDPDALDELAARVAGATGVHRTALTWNKAKERWLADVGRLAGELEEPAVVSPEAHAKVQAQLDAARAALTESSAENCALEERLEAYKTAATDEERRAALLPSDDIERFHVLRKEAAAAVARLDPIVQDVMRHEATEGPMSRPSVFEDQYRADDARAAEQAGYLAEDSDGLLTTNTDIRKVKNAHEAVAMLRQELEQGGFSPDFDEWFEEEYEAPPNLRLGVVWDALLR